MNKLIYNYHSHTFRCGHASGSDEEYILSAIKAGFLNYGVSDHIFLPRIIHPNMRGEFSMLQSYIQSFNALKDKYKENIKIRIGFEAEYMSQYVDYYKSLLDNHQIDYLILGQHCYYDEGKPKWYITMNPIEAINKYTDHLIKGIESRLFKYVAHPDMFCIFYDKWDDLSISCSQKIIDASIKFNVPLEVNLCKIRAIKKGCVEKYFKAIYPYINFWKLVAKSKAHVIIGVDSHNPDHNINSEVEYIDELIKVTGITIDWNYKL